MSNLARLVLRDAPSRTFVLDPRQPLTIGREATNKLCLSTSPGLSRHHAVVKFSRAQGCWLVCDWQSSNGTYLEGRRIKQCRALSDGDQIRLGAQGPGLIFETYSSEPESQAERPRPSKQAGETGALRNVEIGDQKIPIQLIQSAYVRSEPRYPQIFSWWLLVAVGGLLLLPIHWLFWVLEILGVGGWLYLGSRKEHRLVLTLRDAMVYRHIFNNKLTALSHRNGIRQLIGMNQDTG